MIANPERNVEKLVDRLIEAEIAEAAALERQDMRAQNRWADRSAAVIKELLLEGEAGKAALEGLLDHRLPMVRVAAAANVLKWAPDRAVPVLNQLLAWAHWERDSTGRRPSVASFVSLDVQGLLSLYYGIGINDVLPRVLGVEE